MASHTVIEENELVNKLTLHAIWSDTSRTGEERAKGAKLSLLDLSISDIKLVHKNLDSAELVRCTISNVEFVDCSLVGAVLIDSVFRNCSFHNCRLVKADLRSADLSHTTVLKCDLRRAELHDAILHSADVTNGNFGGAWLVETDMRYAVLEHTDFQGARLIGTKMFNRRKFVLGSFEGAFIDNVDVSPEGDGSKTVNSIDEILALIGDSSPQDK